MKRILLIIAFILFTTTHFYGQRVGNGKIKALKTAFITNALDLSSKEAEKFWPIYNEYNRTINLVKTQKRKQLVNRTKAAGGIDNLSDTQANKLLQELIEIDFKVTNAKKKLQQNLLTIISAKKIIKLFRAEQDFNRELLKRFREARKENIQKRIRN